MTGPTRRLLLLAWRGDPPPAPDGWRSEAVLRDQSALDRAGSKGHTRPPYDTLWWSDEPGDADAALPEKSATAVARWAGFRFESRPAWDDATPRGLRPEVKQVSFVSARADLAPGEFGRHYREHVDVARVHHPAVCRYAQHDVVTVTGDAGLTPAGISELWFPDEATLVARYFAGPDSVAVVRADNREYIDYAGTLSLLVRPDDRGP